MENMELYSEVIPVYGNEDASIYFELLPYMEELQQS